jgi:hypothetical protein
VKHVRIISDVGSCNKVLGGQRFRCIPMLATKASVHPRYDDKRAGIPR